MNLEKKLLDYLMVYCDETGDHISKVLTVFMRFLSKVFLRHILI